jgi:hypothetical protein
MSIVVMTGKGNYRPEADIKKPAEEGFASIE